MEGGRNAATWWPATTSTGVCGCAELGAADERVGAPGQAWAGMAGEVASWAVGPWPRSTLSDGAW